MKCDKILKICGMDSTLPEIDVCIVGGGLSGLTAAYKILKKEPTLKVLVLESNRNIGGELYSSKLGELGGKWITPNQYHIYDLCTQLKIELKRRDMAPNLNSCWELDKGILAPIARFEVYRVIKEVNLNATRYRPGTFKLENSDITMERFICRKLFLEQSRQFIRCFIRLLAGVETQDISHNEFMSICQGSGNFAEIIELFTGTSSMIYEFSSEKLLRTLEEFINTYHIFLNTNITEIVHYSDYVLVKDEQNNTFRTSVLIMAIPWQKIQRIVFYPPIPSELRIPIFENKYMITSFLVKYSNSVWRDGGFSGSLVMHNPHTICYEYELNTYGGLVLHEEDFQEILQPIVLKRLSEIFGTEMATPLFWLQRTWEQATILNLPSTTPWNHIVWGSSTAATCYRGCLSGAVQSGYRAAVHALLILRPQNIQWQDIDAIQKAAAVKPRIGWFTMKLSSLNLYNSVFYIGVTCVAFISFKLIRIARREWFN